MKIRMLFFASVREQLKRADEVVEMPNNATVASLLDELGRRHAGFQGLRPACKVAVNQEFVGDDHVLSDGDEVALIPPVAGG